jgi:hypothetical protein
MRENLPMNQAEVIDSAELAKRWGVSETWIRNQTRPSRTSDPIPHLRLGKKPHFLWGSPGLEAWLERRCVGCNQNGHGAGSSERRKQ